MHCSFIRRWKRFLLKQAWCRYVFMDSCINHNFSQNLQYVHAITKLAIYDFSLQDRQMVRNLCPSEQRPNCHETDENLIPFFRKLHSQGLTEMKKSCYSSGTSFSSCIELNPVAAQKNRQSMTACSLLRFLLLRIPY